MRDYLFILTLAAAVTYVLTPLVPPAAICPATGKFTLLVAASGAHGIAFTPDETVHSVDNDQHGPQNHAALHLQDGHWFV
jgi:hypothetical protein